MRVRRFSADRGSKVPGGHPGLFAVPVLWDQALARGQDSDDLARRLNGAPLLVDAPVAVAALYFDPNARMDEHDADHPILLLVTSGQGFVRLGGAAGETRAIGAGDAVLWPAGILHTVWTEDQPLAGIAVECPRERGAAD